MRACTRTSRSPCIPIPITGMHCWHQMVRVERAGADDRYGDIFVDTNLSFAVYQRWKALARPAPGPGGLRRPLWIPRVHAARGSGVLHSQSEEGTDVQ